MASNGVDVTGLRYVSSMGNYTIPTILLVLYLMLIPAVSFALKRWDKSREMKLMVDNKAKKKSDQNVYNPIHPTWKERLRYANSDKRHVAFKLHPLVIKMMPKPEVEEGKEPEKPKETFELPQVQRRMVTLGSLLLGAVCAFTAVLTPVPYILLILSLVFWGAYVIISLISPRWFLNEKAKVTRKLTDAAEKKLKIPKELAPGCWTVESWDDETNLEPTKLTFDISSGFTEGTDQALLKNLNAVLTNTRTYVLDDEDGKNPIDQKDGILRVRAKPPMPVMATFDPYYIFAPGIEAGAFAIGLGDSGGAQLPIKEGSETMVQVIYVNMSGEAEKYASKHGLAMVAPPTPMVLIMGPTGSGKAQAITDLIERTQFYVFIDGVKTIVEDIPYDPDNPTQPKPQWSQGQT